MAWSVKTRGGIEQLPTGGICAEALCRFFGLKGVRPTNSTLSRAMTVRDMNGPCIPLWDGSEDNQADLTALSTAALSADPTDRRG